jgi:hypothetical protein
MTFWSASRPLSIKQKVSRQQHIISKLHPYAPPELSEPAMTRIRLVFAIFVVCLLIIVERMLWLKVKVVGAVIGMISPSRFRAALLFSLLHINLVKIILDGSLYAKNPQSESDSSNSGTSGSTFC